MTVLRGVTGLRSVFFAPAQSLHMPRSANGLRTTDSTKEVFVYSFCNAVSDSASDRSVTVQWAVCDMPGYGAEEFGDLKSPTTAKGGGVPRRLRPNDFRCVYFKIKDPCERLLAGLALFAVSPLILLLVALVRLTSKGPGIYRQERVGLNQATFDVFKLRTMFIDAEADGQAKWSQKGDSRITLLGRFLRRTHLDELPQLFNVAAGDMSLTGPRPERPCICEKLQSQICGYYDRTVVKPGITGLAQINLEPDSCIDDVRRKQCLDLNYIEHASPWLDLRIIMTTVLRVVGIRGPVVTRWMGLCRISLIESAGLTQRNRSPMCRSTC